MTTSSTAPAADLQQENAHLQIRLANLELQLAASRRATARAYSALLEQSMDATLEDGTPVLSLALAHDPELRARMERVFLPQAG